MFFCWFGSFFWLGYVYFLFKGFGDRRIFSSVINMVGIIICMYVVRLRGFRYNIRGYSSSRNIVGIIFSSIRRINYCKGFFIFFIVDIYVVNK